VLLHELGHMYGVQHIENTFMSEVLPAKLLQTRFDSKLTATQLFHTFSLCGTPIDLSADGVLQGLGVDIAMIEKACFNVAVNQPFGSESELYKLDLHMKNLEVKSFDVAIEFALGPGYEIGGQYLTRRSDGKPVYSKHVFRYLRGVINMRGTIAVGTQKRFINVTPSVAGTLAFDIGAADRWQRFYIINDIAITSPFMKTLYSD
ncbi:MAG: hypothetical protein M3Q07_10950, partial [Pseudobdellovibrionaceae bacterium]|nr:hypothetical protein [Pseudobdellovibrionaceae bacterium]